MNQPDESVDPPARATPLEYARPLPPTPGARAGRIVAITLVCLVGCFVLAIAVLRPIARPRVMSHRVMCASNMRQIGQAIAMYANDHGGQFPNDLETVFVNEDIASTVFVCPSSSDTPPPPGPTTQATADGLRQPGHCSYVYLGKGLTTQTVADDMVLLYEPLSDHEGQGMNVMFGDFHVEWVPAATAQKILTQHAASTQPIRLKIDASSP
ncbi:MAG TPA: hypothetical protein VGI81_26450 [Tepidisphaeraceae bacterium]|jgi:prepilin-type processing-associated H-X9-DG protein